MVVSAAEIITTDMNYNTVDSYGCSDVTCTSGRTLLVIEMQQPLKERNANCSVLAIAIATVYRCIAVLAVWLQNVTLLQ